MIEIYESFGIHYEIINTIEEMRRTYYNEQVETQQTYYHDHLKTLAENKGNYKGIEKKDEYGTRMPYAFDALTLETEGPIEVIGPKNITLVGGSAAVWVRSLPSKNETVATLIVKNGSEEKRIQFVVE